jgi:tellurite resistance-related uncharacterized protein
MKALPSSVQKYKQTPLFTASSVPKSLLSKHNTKMGTWGNIVVEVGALKYEIFDAANEIVETVTLEAGKENGVIEPQVYHKVTLLTASTSFFIEFHGASDVTVPAFIKDASDVQSTKGGNGAAAMGCVLIAGLAYEYCLRRK